MSIPGFDAIGRLSPGQLTRGIVTITVLNAGSGSYTITGLPAPLVRTGGDYDQVYGGIGHYLEEIERLKSLARITRKTPAPVVQPPAPRLPPVAAQLAPPVAPQAPPIDLQAVADQRMAEAQKAEQAKILHRRRQTIELLLLAS